MRHTRVVTASPVSHSHTHIHTLLLSVQGFRKLWTLVADAEKQLRVRGVALTNLRAGMSKADLLLEVLGKDFDSRGGGRLVKEVELLHGSLSPTVDEEARQFEDFLAFNSRTSHWRDRAMGALAVLSQAADTAVRHLESALNAAGRVYV